MKSPKMSSLEISGVHLNMGNSLLCQPELRGARPPRHWDIEIKVSAKQGLYIVGLLGGAGKHRGIKGLWWIV